MNKLALDNPHVVAVKHQDSIPRDTAVAMFAERHTAIEFMKQCQLQNPDAYYYVRSPSYQLIPLPPGDDDDGTQKWIVLSGDGETEYTGPMSLKDARNVLRMAEELDKWNPSNAPCLLVRKYQHGRDEEEA